MVGCMANELPEEAKEFFRAAGSKGGRKTYERHGAEHYAKISSAGGKAAKAAREAREALNNKESGD